MSGALEIAELHSLPDAARDRVQAIYEEAFPARQREPFGDLVSASRDGDEVTVIAVQDGQPIGLAFLSHLDAVDHLFLEYFAVDAARRGGGIGHALWEATAGALEARGDGRPIVLEVEDPREPGVDCEEAAQRVRRMRFWEQLGARVVALEGYVIPSLDGTGVEPMRLMRIAAPAQAGDASATAPLALVIAIYEAGYGLDRDADLVERARRLWG